MVDRPPVVLRASGGAGGSSQTRPQRRRATREKRTALDRAIARLGEDVVKQLQSTNAALDSKWGGSQHAQAEGMARALIDQGVPDAQIRAIFGVGGSMIARLKKSDSLQGTTPKAPKHALTTDDLAFFFETSKDWELEDGFPCAHRRPRQYFVDSALTLTLLWDHRKSDRPFFAGWEELLSKYFKRMPDNYTANYFFEIDEGIVTMKHLVNTKDADSQTFSLIGNGDACAIRQAFLADLFGPVSSIDTATTNDVRLRRQPLLEPSTKKITSLKQKYFSIPDKFLGYYPEADSSQQNESTADQEETCTSSKTKSKLAVGVARRAKPKLGRPRKQPAGPKNPSILSFFKPLNLTPVHIQLQMILPPLAPPPPPHAPP